MVSCHSPASASFLDPQSQLQYQSSAPPSGSSLGSRGQEPPAGAGRSHLQTRVYTSLRSLRLALRRLRPTISFDELSKAFLNAEARNRSTQNNPTPPTVAKANTVQNSIGSLIKDAVEDKLVPTSNSIRAALIPDKVSNSPASPNTIPPLSRDDERNWRSCFWCCVRGSGDIVTCTLFLRY